MRHRLLYIVAFLGVVSFEAAALAASTYEPYSFTQFAGTAGNFVGGDGVRSTGRFRNPSSAAVDGAGNVYVADTANHTIRKITSSGAVTTLAGSPGVSGAADGTGSAARFNSPLGVAVDVAGNVYVSDTSNHTIRKITPAGMVTTLAGLAGMSGSADGTGSAAQFFNPIGVAVDSDGNVYVADSDNHTIREVTSAGVVTTIAGLAGNPGSVDGTGSAAQFRNPRGIAVDSGANLYVADYNNHTIRKITSAAVVSTIAGLAGAPGTNDGTGSAARFNLPSGPTVDGSGNIFVADTINDTIRQITPGNVVSTIAGNVGNAGSSDGAGSAAHFAMPNGVTVDGSGNLFVSDSGNQTIRKIVSGNVVSTFAGAPGVTGAFDGPSNAAHFNLPNSVALDATGNVYIADTMNHAIRKLSAGIVTTLAGSPGTQGSMDGSGSSALFFQPRGIAVDSSGNVYVADTLNSTIRKITPAGVVSTFAGLAGNPGNDDGTGSAARFNQPVGIAVDSSGNVYVGDTANQTIRKITSGGVVTTLAGSPGVAAFADGTGSSARFNNPNGVTVDSVGNIYVADKDNQRIRKITPGGTVSTRAGTGAVGGDDGPGVNATFNSPTGVSADSIGNVFVTDELNFTIRKVTPGGFVTTLAGVAGISGGADGIGTNAEFLDPTGLSVDGRGNMYVADNSASTIRKVTLGGAVGTIAGVRLVSGASDGLGFPARFDHCSGIDIDNAGNVYVADTNSHIIRKISPNGIVTTIAGLFGFSGSADGIGSAARFQFPSNLCVDKSGTIYVADYSNQTIRKITPAGVVTTFAGSAGTASSEDGNGSAAHFSGPHDVALDSAGNLYVADYSNHTIRKITPAADVTTLAGTAGAIGSSDGTGSAAQFSNPSGVAVDSAGNVYVADSGNDIVRKITPGAVVTTLAGSPDNPGSNDGTGSAAQFDLPVDVAVDNAGNVYVAEYNNDTIRKVTPAGVVTTLGGLTATPDSTDGLGSGARFNSPTGIAVDAAQNIYVADYNNDTIRFGTPPLSVAAVASHKVHDTVSGDIDLLPTHAKGIECRSGGPSNAYQIVTTLAASTALTVLNATATPDPTVNPPATGSVNSFSVSGSQVTIDLTNVSNAQTILVNLGVTDGTNTTDMSIPLTVLVGDTTGDGSVNSADIAQTKSKSGQIVDLTNFRNDVTVDGSLNSADISLVKSKSGTALPMAGQ